MVYMGSKNRIAEFILPIILKNRKPNQYYVELFCGGCNLIDKVTGPRIANDFNSCLIALWKALQNGYIPPSVVTERDYFLAKDYEFLFLPETIAFIGICCSFGAKWFGGYARNKKGDNYAACGVVSLLKQKLLLDSVIFSSLSYEKVSIPENSIVYFDFPYKGTAEYKHKNFDHNKAYEYARLLVRQGHTVFISEYTAPKDFIEVWSKPLKSNLSAKDNKQGIEKLFQHHSQLDL